MAELEFLVPKEVPAPRANYSHAVRILSGTHIVLAGQVPIDEHGKTVGIGDIDAQTRQVLQNIEGVLRSAGASFADVVKYTIYLVGRQHAARFREVRAEPGRRCTRMAAIRPLPSSSLINWLQRSSSSRSRPAQRSDQPMRSRISMLRAPSSPVA